MALVIGINPNDFWRMTPHHLNIHLDAHEINKKERWNREAWMMYHGAVLARGGFDEFPPLDDFLYDALKSLDKKEKEVPAIDEGAIISRMKMHNAVQDEIKRRDKAKDGPDS